MLRCRGNTELEAILRAANEAQKYSNLALVDANRAKEAAIKELNELRQSYDLVCTSMMAVVEENKELAEKLKKMEFETTTIKESSYNFGWATAYEDVDAQIGYISRLNFKKGWNKALLTVGVDVNSPLFDEHDPGPKPVIDNALVPAVEGVPPAS